MREWEPLRGRFVVCVLPPPRRGSSLTAAGLAIAITSSGAFRKFETTPVMTQGEMLDALHVASNVYPPVPSRHREQALSAALPAPSTASGKSTLSDRFATLAGCLVTRCSPARVQRSNEKYRCLLELRQRRELGGASGLGDLSGQDGEGQRFHPLRARRERQRRG
jgi:hypothetical protein